MVGARADFARNTSVRRKGANSARRTSVPQNSRIVAGAALAIALGVSAYGAERAQLLQVFPESTAERVRLIQFDADCAAMETWSHDLGGEAIDVRVTEESRAMLDAEGFHYDVEVDDLGALWAEYFTSPTAGDFFERYQSYDEHVTFMEDLVSRYPNLATMVNIGPTVEGRFQWAIRITGPGPSRKRPAVLYHGAQHGNEITGPPVIAYTARHLLENYSTDPDVTWMVDHVEWFLMPIMNPDGYEAGSRSNRNGYDLNRNWAGPGSRANPFSQPETDNLRRFMEKHDNLKAYVDLHTYGRYILWAWGHTPHYPQENPSWHRVGDRMAELIRQHRGENYNRRGPIYTTIYPVSGGSNDYSFGVHDIIAMTFELGDRYGVPENEILPTCIEILPALLYMTQHVSDCNQNGRLDGRDIERGVSFDCNDNGMPDECESQQDCDGDLVLDICEFHDVPDCNGNAVPDACDIASGKSDDDDGNGVPDECDADCARVQMFRARCKGSKIVASLISDTIRYRPQLRVTLDRAQPRWLDANGAKTRTRWRRFDAGEHEVRVDVCSPLTNRVACP